MARFRASRNQRFSSPQTMVGSGIRLFGQSLSLGDGHLIVQSIELREVEPHNLQTICYWYEDLT